MSRIKTRESVKDIKVIDKAAVASERMKTALVRSKDQFENLMDDGQVSVMMCQPRRRRQLTKAKKHIGNIVRKSGSKRMRSGSTAMKSASAGRNWPEPRRLLLRNLIHMNRLHDPQSRRDLRNRGVSLHPNGKLSLRSKTLFGRGRMSTSRTPSERQHPPAVKSERTLYAELEIRPSKQRSERNTRLSSPPVLSERRP